MATLALVAGAPAAQAAISIGDVSVNEGAQGATLTFTVTKSYVLVLGSDATVRARITGGTATPGVDYTETAAQTLSLPNTAFGGSSRTFTVPVTADALDEPDETVVVTLDQASGDSISTAVGTGTIVDDDDPPSVTIAGGARAEGTGAAGYVPFAVALSSPSGRAITVPYTVNPGTASAPEDIDGSPGELSFAPGQSTAELRIPTVGDDVDEADEIFSVSLGTPTAGGATLGEPATATGTVLNDDAPVASITGLSRAEGTATAPTPFAFTVSLSKAGRVPASVRVTSGDVQAVAPGDYAPVDERVTFAVGETTKTVTVNVVADAVREPDEAFTMTLSDPVGTTIGTAVALGAVINDDAAATVPGTGTGTGAGTGTGTGTGTGSGTGTPTGPIDARQPIVRLTAPSYRRSGARVRVRVTCPATEVRCTGAVTVFNVVQSRSKVKALRRESRVARGTFTLAGGKSTTLSMKTTSAGRKLLRSVKKLKVRAYGVAKDAAGNTGIATKSGTLKR